MIHEERMAVISTAHLTSDEAAYITDHINEGRFNGMAREEGWLVYTDQAVIGYERMSFILGYLRGQGFAWVLFDRDADVVDELPTSDW